MAPSAAPDQILFVPYFTYQTSQKTRDLHRARALAHAARHSHRKRREKKTDVSTTNLKTASVHTTTCRKLPFTTDSLAVRRKNANVDGERSSVMAFSSVIDLLGPSRLDPFDTGSGTKLPQMVVEVLEWGESISLMQPDRYHAIAQEKNTSARLTCYYQAMMSSGRLCFLCLLNLHDPTLLPVGDSEGNMRWYTTPMSSPFIPSS